MSIDLNPAVEIQVLDRARAAGTSVSDYIAQLLQSDVQANRENDVESMLASWQREYGLPVPVGGFRTAAELFAQWNAEDACMSDEDRDVDRRFWLEFERGRQRVHI